MNWDHMRILLALHRAGSFRGAASALKVNHATVARALEGAEHSLGTRLFDRSSRGLTLTQPGELLLPHAQEMEQRMLEVQRRLTGLDNIPSGTLRVSLPPSFGHSFFVSILVEFTERFPDIRIDAVPTNKISDLSRQEADVSIRAARQIDDDLVGRRLVDYVNAAFATPDYIRDHPDLAASHGQGAHWIGWEADDKWIAQTPMPMAAPRHKLPEVFMQTEAAAAGLGMAWVPAFLGDMHSGLVRVPDVPVGPGRSIWVLMHGDLRHSARVRAFVDFIAEWFAVRRPMFTE
ncbi:transcriptional regulator [Tateyamaria omphalii]|uniref:LysR family transcriptional regulator n=1 Tax=Tateyamaria omphalii TaxID=299262 RepID=UPI001676843A|nr:LysR family transcriptional regulator [Tateyamaria omphalii]GGX43096.1 transcriptional regulator [Tateyamaria omphalii]